MVRIRLSIVALAAIAVVLVAGCGSGGGGSSSSEPASLAAPGSVVFVEGNLRPTGQLKAKVDLDAKLLAGTENLGDTIVSELESSSRSDGEPVDFDKEIDPWLGRRGGVSFSRLEDGELSEPLIAIETTNAKATQSFIDKQANVGGKPFKSGSYEGIGFKVGGEEDDAIGVVGEWLVIADGEREFKAAVDASNGDSLADESRFQDAISAASDGSLVDVYVDVGGLIAQSGDQVDPQAREILQNSGIDPSEATAVASLIPGSATLEIDFSSDLAGEKAPSGDSSKLLGSLPGSSFAAFAFSGFGEQLEEAIDNLDEAGSPPDLPPGELKSTLAQAGIDLDKIVGSLEEGAVFAEGSDRNSLGGALVVTSSSSEASDALASLGELLRSARVPGVTAIGGKASGFSIRSDELGNKPLVVVGQGDRLAIGYGLAAARAGLQTEAKATLSQDPAYQAAASALGELPISAYAAGPNAVHVAEVLVPRSATDFWNVAPYLRFTYIGLGTDTDGDRATAKLVAGIGD